MTNTVLPFGRPLLPTLVDGVRTFSGPQVCVATGLTYRELDYWLRTGRLDVSATPGSGVPRTLTADVAIRAAVIKHLRAAGLDLDTAVSIARSGEHEFYLGSSSHSNARGPGVHLSFDLDAIRERVLGVLDPPAKAVEA